MRGLLRGIFIFIGLAIFTVLTKAEGETNVANKVIIHFVGITNEASGTSALFNVTNPTPATVAYIVDAVIVRTNGIWQTNAVAPGGGTPPPWQVAGLLMTGTNGVVHVPAPVTNAPWRVRLLCMEQAAGVKGLIDKAKDATRKIATGNSSQRFGGRNYWVLSPVCEPSEGRERQ